MARYQADAKYIASIYPSAVEKITQFHGADQDVNSPRATIYHLPRVIRGVEPELESYMKKNVKIVRMAGHHRYIAVMEVVDAFENVPDTQPEAMGHGRLQFQNRGVRCEDIANNLITRWCKSIVGLPTGAQPGIMIIANTSPTQDELQQMAEMQAMYYQYRLAEGDRLYMEKNFRGISQQMKDAAVYLDVERTWSGAYGTVGTTDCPFCFSQIHPKATRCPHCQGDIAMVGIPAPAENPQPSVAA